MNTSLPDSVSAQFAAVIVAELLRAWHQLNATLFRRALMPPQIALSPKTSRLGCWEPHTRSLEMSEALVFRHPWGHVLEVLKHEMAHQYVHEVLGRTDETAHGAAFLAVCKKWGIDASSSGLPKTATRSEQDLSPQAQKLRRIARLLSLAESQNLHEAESAMQKAQDLLLKYNLELPTQKTTSHSFLHLGKPARRVDEHLRLIAMVLGRYFFVETIWVKSFDVQTGLRGSILEILGRPENLEMAAYVYEFLSQQAERLWSEHKRGLANRRDRRTFLSGVISGFSNRLKQQNLAQQEQGLVWVADAELSHYLRQRYPNIRHVRSKGQPKNSARSAGERAGERLVLHKPLTQAASLRTQNLALPARERSVGG
ncbi:MAG TPA: DUF2786 domain-containing protein [Pseudomonadota bacterium]|nr:DUF2786 domain-containing protein [Pseudomonadota bacterium]